MLITSSIAAYQKEENKEAMGMKRSTQTKPSIVFCHGIWADGSCFNKVIPSLQAEGYEVMAAQYGLDTLAGDVAAVKRTLGRVSSPAILVGHSYGGAVITAAGTDDRVAGLVYIAAVAPDEKETVQSQLNQFPATDVFSHIAVADGRVWMLPDGVAYFAGDLSEEEQKVVWATHYAPAADLFPTGKPDGVAWRSKPSWYIVAKNDRSVHPELERFVAKRMGATTYEVDSSHVPMLSNPKLVLDVIRTAANAVNVGKESAAV
jgi:pimeloyl-ACP methyl ester carboxylesterase